MRLAERFRSLYAYVILWIIFPLTLVILGTMLAAAITYRYNMTQLILDRHQQMASLAAVSVSLSLDDYAQLLVSASQQPASDSGIVSIFDAPGEPMHAAQSIFTAGIYHVDQDGFIDGAGPNTLVHSGIHFSTQQVFIKARDQLVPSFSSLIRNPNSENEQVFIAVPILDEQGYFNGAIIGALDLRTGPLGGPVHTLEVGTNGFAYLVDSEGFILSHPDPEQIGMSFTDRPYIGSEQAQRNTGRIWRSPDGEQFVGASAPVSSTGWHLIIKEPLESIHAPARLYGLIVSVVGMAAVILVSLFVLEGTIRVTAPIQRLVDQTALFSSGDISTAETKSSILEIDQLGSALKDMANRIATYRTGMRRYVGAITRAQEEERLRISRELHDETIQSLLAIARRLELYRSAEDEPDRAQQLQQLYEMVNQSVKEVRNMSQDLRPMALEDLGLVPAIQMLVRAAHQGEGAIPHVDFELKGSPAGLNPDQNLAIYRITQEALGNSRKHAGATAVWVELEFGEKNVRLTISDDGKGFDLPDSINMLVQEGRLGLMGIQERVWSVEGHLAIEAKPGLGTKILVTIPI
jgi:signal transduction histidine kinase